MRNLRLLGICLFSFLLLASSQVWAQTFSAPVPVGSDDAQVANIPAALRSSRSSNATNLKFFNHPATASGTANFSTTSLDVTLEGITYNMPVQDLVAVPGLMAEPRVRATDLSQMLDEMIAVALGSGRSSSEFVEPMQGFCPEPLVIENSVWNVAGRNAAITINFMCDVQRSTRSRPNFYNQSDYQLEVADIRNTTGAGEFATLIDGDALVPTALGDAQQSLAPYSAQTYPTTIGSDQHFAYQGKLIEERPGMARIRHIENLVAPYVNMFTYGLADLEQSVVTAAYDPVLVEKLVALAGNFFSADLAGVPASCRGSEGCFLGQATIDPSMPGFEGLYEALLTHVSPLIFFRKDQSQHRLRLSGYSTLQFADIDIEHLPGTMGNFLWQMLMSLNFNTIDVQHIARQSDGQHFLAVVNQATLGSIDYPVVDLALRRVPFSDGSSYNWRALLGTGAGTGFVPLRHAGEPGEIYFPHSAVSYVTFWQQENDSINPNEAFQPVAFGLIGPGAYSSTNLTDVIGDTTRQYFVVASGDITTITDAIVPPNYYIYKFTTEPTEENALYFDPQPARDNANIWPTPGIVAEPYLVKSPYGFAPYEVQAADLDGNGCSEIILTHRGADTAWVPPLADETFSNRPGENVRFQSSVPDDHRMFSDCFTVYFGQVSGDKCVFGTSRRDFCGALESSRQIASVAITDTNNDGHLDIVAGDLVPYEVPGTGTYTGYAHVYEGPIIPTASGGSVKTRGEADDYIRFGYETTTYSPFSEASGTPADYLAELAEGSDKGVVGVGKLTVDANGNLAAVLGLPVMLPSMGCPQYDVREDTTVASWPEMWMALLRERAVPNSSRLTVEGYSNIMPARCIIPGDMPSPPSFPRREPIPRPETGPDPLLDDGGGSGPLDETTGEYWVPDFSGRLTPGDDGRLIGPDYRERICLNPEYIYRSGESETLPCCSRCEDISSPQLALCRDYCDGPGELDADFEVMCEHIMEECDDGDDSLGRYRMDPDFSGRLTPGDADGLDVPRDRFGRPEIPPAGSGPGVPGTAQVPGVKPGEDPTLRPGPVYSPADIPAETSPTIGEIAGPRLQLPRVCEDNHEYLDCCAVATTCDSSQFETGRTSLEECLRFHCVPSFLGRLPEYNVLCEMIQCCVNSHEPCPIGEPESSLDKTNRTKFLAKDSEGSDSDSADSNESDFARKCDRVYDSQASYLAFIDELKLAAAQTKDDSKAGANQAAPKKTKLGLVVDQYLKQLNVPEEQAQKISQALQNYFAGPPQSLADVLIRPILFQLIYDMKLAPVNPETKPNAKNMLEVKPFVVSPSTCQPFVLSLSKDENVSKSSFDNAQDERGISKVLNYLTSLFVNEAQAAEFVDAPFSSHFRLPRGQVMRGPKEMTVVLKSTAGLEPEEPIFDEEAAEDDPSTTCPTCADCACPCACCPTEDGRPCAMADAIEIVTRCTGWSTPVAKKQGQEINRLIRDAIREGGGEPKDNDFFCESEAKMQVWLNIPQAASISKASTTQQFSAVVAPNALIQVSGTYPDDYTLSDKLPTKTHTVDSPKILFPLASSAGAGKATFTMPNLSLAAEGVFDSAINAALSQAAPLEADLVTSIGVLDTGTYNLNNVLQIDINAAPTQGLAVNSDIGSAVIYMQDNIRPYLCSWTASCPDTEATLPENSFAELNFKEFLAAVKENARECKNGYCPHKVFEKGWPAYQRYGYIWVQDKTVLSEASANMTNIPIGYVGGMPFETAAGSGCGCSINAPMPNLLSLIVMLLFAGLPIGIRLIYFRRR
ncbi:MAG: FG-GAP repeat protein [Pseudomonadota bacterium]